MEYETYIGFECSECGEVWNINSDDVTVAPQCPECEKVIHNSLQFQATIAESTLENGMYECYDCGHMFSYMAVPVENPNETPDCTHCGSSNVDLMY